MAIEYRVRFENGSMVISQSGAGVQETGQAIGSPAVIQSRHLGASFGAVQGGGTNPNTDTGGGTNPNTDTGGGTNPNTDTGGRIQRTLSPVLPYASSFQMERQQESEWCWAAVSASVDHYFDPSSSLTQCEIASAVTKGDSCSDPASFDRPERLTDALTAVGKLKRVTGPLMFEQVQAELNASRPVCVRVQWNGEGAHFVAISGYNVLPSGVRTIEIADPHYADSTVDFDLFPSQYHGGGTWTTTYLTKGQEGRTNVDKNTSALSYTTEL